MPRNPITSAKAARIAVLAKRGLGIDGIVSHLQKRYHPKLSQEGIRHIYFRNDRRGGRQNLTELFMGKTPSEIDANFKAWSEKHNARIKWISSVHKGKKISEEQKAILRAYKLGTTLPKETKDKISAKLKGKPLTEATKKKISIASKGKTLSKVTRAKLSDATTDYWGKLKGSIIAEMEAQGLSGGHEDGVQGRSRRVPVYNTPELRISRRNRDRIVREAVSGLPEQQRRIVYLRFGFWGEDFEIDEIARHLSSNGRKFTPDIVRTQLETALKTLSQNPKLIELVSPER